MKAPTRLACQVRNRRSRETARSGLRFLVAQDRAHYADSRERALVTRSRAIGALDKNRNDSSRIAVACADFIVVTVDFGANSKFLAMLLTTL
jgi:hypothetical protein